jgi:hypothetical protein
MVNRLKHLETQPSRIVGTLGSGTAVRVDLTPQPPEVLHPVEDGVQSPGADFESVVAQFLEHPLTDHGSFGGMMKDMDLPESEEDLPLQGLPIIWFH